MFGLIVMLSIAATEPSSVRWQVDSPPAEARHAGNWTYRTKSHTAPDGMVTPVVSVQTADGKELTVSGDLATTTSEALITVRRLQSDDRQPALIVQTYSGGAHCCTRIQVVAPAIDGPKVLDLGAYDGGPEDGVGSDIDGDGIADFRLPEGMNVVEIDRKTGMRSQGGPDFRLPDRDFVDQFGADAAGRAPNVVLNIVDGTAFDVSDEARFRAGYDDAASGFRGACAQGGAGVDAACAAYIAVASRLGRLDEAWDFVMQHGNYGSEQGWVEERACPDKPDQICYSIKPTKTGYLARLRVRLIKAGYLTPLEAERLPIL